MHGIENSELSLCHFLPLASPFIHPVDMAVYKYNYAGHDHACIFLLNVFIIVV